MKKVWNILSTAIPIAIILFCFLGFLFAPNDPSVTDVMNKYQSASAQYPFGTDNMGRCEFSRILATVSWLQWFLFVVFSSFPTPFV